MDRRLIQTAVFGSADSDDPAVCPETVEELKAFRLEHKDQTIWCGTKFEGGCGRRLTTRLCTDKICHFAHYASDGSTEPCRRTAKGKDSANHLFAKAHLASWLNAQSLTARFSYPQPLGSAVIAHLDDGRTLLVHLDRNLPVGWDGGYWEVILGPGVRVPATILNQRGYVQRLRFKDRPGGGRVMRFGTEQPGQGTTWDIPDDVKLTPKGLNTTTRPDATRLPLTDGQRQHTPSEPGPRTIVTISSRSDTASAVRQDDAVKRAVMHLNRALREPQRVYAAVRTIKRLLQKETLPENIARLRIALDHGEKLVDQRARERGAILQQLQQTPTAPLLAKAEQLMGDENVSVAEREILRLAREKYHSAQAARRRLEAERNAAQKLQREEELRSRREERARAYAQEEAERRERAERAQAERRAAKLQAEREHAEKLAYLTPFVLGALKKAAREERVTTWHEMAERTGQRGLARLTHQDRLTVLEAVEKKTSPDTPLWSAVLAATGTHEALQLHRDLAEHLQRQVPNDDAELLAQVTAECALLRRQW